MTEPAGAEGITFLDHTADVGIEVRAPSLELLFHRAAVGMLMLLQGRDDGDDAGWSEGAGGSASSELDEGRGIEVLTLELEADETRELLADWLRELLFLHETRHADYARATFDRLGTNGLEARVQTEPAPPAVREIKGVTYHELTAERTADGWKARVIFDV